MVLGVTVNTSNVHGTSQTWQGMPAARELGVSLLSTKVGLAAFDSFVLCNPTSGWKRVHEMLKRVNKRCLSAVKC